MQLLLDCHVTRLVANGRLTQAGGAGDYLPVVRLYMPDASASWLLSEIDPDDTDLAFGLCDLGLGFPELGYVRLSEIAGLRGHIGLPVARDDDFTAHGPISAYADAARRAQRIVCDKAAIDAARRGR